MRKKIRRINNVTEQVVYEETVKEESKGVISPSEGKDLFEVVLPHGYKVACYGRDEYDQVMLDARPYIKADIPQDYGRMVYILVTNYLKYYRIQKQLDNPSDVLLNNPKEYNALLQQQHKVSADITKFAEKADPLKFKDKGEDATGAEFLEQQLRLTRDYAKTRRGEFEWMCAHCNGVNLMEVPHFAFDMAGGPTQGVWNQTIMEMVRKHYVPDDPELEHYEGSLSVKDAARILRVSPFAILMACLPEEKNFDLGFTFDPDKPETFRAYVT